MTAPHAGAARSGSQPVRLPPDVETPASDRRGQRTVSRRPVAVVMVNYNGRGYTRDCLASLERALRPGDLLLLVDNASHDQSVEDAGEWVRSRAGRWSTTAGDTAIHYRVIRLPENVGFGRACNAAVSTAPDFDFYWFLNNDTEVDPETLDALVEAAERCPDAGFVGSMIYLWPDREKVWANGGRVSLISGLSAHDLTSGAGRIRRVGYVSGCSMLVRGEVFRQVSGLNPAFFMYYEETELQVRAAKAGFRSYVAERSRVGHKVAERVGVSAFHAFQTMRSQVIFLRLQGRWQPFGLIFAILHRVGGHLWRRRYQAVAPALRGAAEGLRARLRAAR